MFFKYIYLFLLFILLEPNLLQAEEIGLKIKNTPTMAQSLFNKGIEIAVIYGNGQKGKGSGVAFKRKTKDDKNVVFILTCAHVLSDLKINGEHSFPKGIAVKTSKGSMRVPDFYIDKKALSINFDVAFAIVTNNTEIFEDAEMVNLNDYGKVGDDVYAVGNPSGMGVIITEGILSKTNCYVLAPHNRIGHYFDVVSNSVSKGFSGGGIFRKSDGKYLGLISMQYAESHYGLIVPSRQILTFLKEVDREYMTNKSIPCPNLKDIFK